MPDDGVRDLVPRPDPSERTSDAVHAATEQWRRELRAGLDLVAVRLDGLREVLLGEIRAAGAVSVERFEAVSTRFVERDTRTEQAAQESRISLDAALAAAKEAVSEQNKANTLAIDKSAAATQKQLDSMLAQMTASNKALDDKITSIQAWQDRREGSSSGAAGSRTERRLDVGQAVAMLALALTVLGLLVAVFVNR